MPSSQSPDRLEEAASGLKTAAGEQPPALTRDALVRLRTERFFSAAAWREAMSFCGFTPDAATWRAYWRHILLLGGALFLAAGVLFFIAWNWTDMHRFGRMALAGGIVAATGLGSVLRGPDTPFGRILLLCCGISVGPMLAVFGQTYQTGAELWELFRVWTAVLFALALVGKQAGLWFVTWLSANVFIRLWLGRTMSEPWQAIGMFSLLPECVLALALAVAAWEVAAYRSRPGSDSGAGGVSRNGWLQSRWLPRLLFFDLTARLTVFMCMWILVPNEIRYLNVFYLPHSVLFPLAPVLAGISWYWHRNRMPDLFMHTCLVAAGCAFVVAALFDTGLLFDAGVAGIFVSGLIVVGLTAGAGRILLALQRRMEQPGKKGGAPFHVAMITDFFGPPRSEPSWETLWARLKNTGLLAQDAPLPRPVPQAVCRVSPWYVRSMLAAGGWVAALLFLAFLVLFVFLALKIDFAGGATLFFVSWIPLGVGYACLKTPGDFIGHFGLSLALAGAVAACIGLGWAVDLWRATPFLCAALLGSLCFAMRSASFRFFSAFAAVCILGVGIMMQFYGRPGMWHVQEADWKLLYRVGILVSAIWWACVSVGLAAMRIREADWLKRLDRRLLEPVFFGTYGGMMLFLSVALSFPMGRGDAWRTVYGPFFFSSNARAVGLGAAAGLLYFVWNLTRDWPSDKSVLTGRAGFIICAALAPPLGWLLPGAGLAAFGLALSRYCGNLAMQGAAAFFLFAYMVYYYYFMGVTLLHKSLLLTGTGAALLSLALVLTRKGKKRRGRSAHA